MQILRIIKDEILESLASLNIKEVNSENVLLEHPADKTHGDYSSNIALTLFKNLKESGSTFNSPRNLAEAISDSLNQKLKNESVRGLNSDLNVSAGPSSNIAAFSKYISNVEVAGPGFINFKLSSLFLLAKMGLVVEKEGDVVEKELTGKKVMVEFTDPNPFKELHIGHLYSNIVGESICKSFEARGAEVKRACYQGDVGMHVSKSIWGMKKLFQENFPDKSLDECLAELDSKSLQEKVSFLGKSYSTGATAYKDDEVAKEKIKDINYLVFISAQETQKELNNFEPKVDYQKYIENFSLESADYLEVKKMYSIGRKWSLDYFDSIYSRVGMSFDEFFFESYVGELGYQIVEEFLEKGVFEKSDGAIIFPGSKYGLHDRVFINSLGLPTYEAKELGLAPEKFNRFKYDLSIVITGNEIDEYFRVLLKALEFTNPELRKKTDHLSHGMVRLPEGKMSSRTGKVITAEWLINEAQKKIKDHMTETRTEFSEDELETVSEIIGLGAIKFAFLKQSIGKDIAFSFDDSLSFSGNSGPYVQYTYVRCSSVLSKAQNTILKLLSAETKSNDSASNYLEKTDGKDEDKDSDNKQDSLDDIVGSLGSDNSINKYFDTLIDIKSYLNHNPNNEENDVLRNIYRYSDVLKLASEDYSPHHLTKYLYELSQSFNAFYGLHKVVDENTGINTQTEFRLMLVQAVAYIIKNGLYILGIKTADKM